MSLEDYRTGDRVEVKVGPNWHSGTVVKEVDVIGVVTVDVDKSSFNAQVSDSSGIRLLREALALGIGTQVSLTGPLGANWPGEATAINSGLVTVKLAGLDGQTVIVSKDVCLRA